MLLLFAGGSPAIGARWSSGAEVTGSRELSSLAAGGARGQPTSSPLLASWALCIFVIPCFSNGHSGRDSQSRAKPAPTHSDRLVLPHGCQRPELRPVHDSCSVLSEALVDKLLALMKNHMSLQLLIVQGIIKLLGGLERDCFMRNLPLFFPLLANLVRCEHRSREVQVALLFALILAAYVGDCCAMAHDNEPDVVADSGATIVVPISAQHKINVRIHLQGTPMASTFNFSQNCTDVCTLIMSRD
ncbi:hypothetical protein ZWY2020_014741 [Hordeum vulgare]|nr:hypothetical protein ZWY2020_014741 [Hordeum vulgare]